MKTLALDDAFWHVTEVFVAVEEIIETSLRILDSDKPNLIHTAFAFVRIIEEFKEPLLGKLAKIPEWGYIDLGLDLKSEFLGKLPAYLQACVQKRKADWLSDPVRAAACVNQIYSYALEPAESRHQSCHSGFVITHRKALTGRMHMNIQARLAHIDTDGDLHLLPSLPNRARALAAPATVRDRWIDAGRPTLPCGL